MSIAINSNFERDQYVASAGQTQFTFSFPIFSQTYIKVYQRAGTATPNDATDLLTLGTDYTVTGTGEEAGGYITLVVPATLNDIVTLVGQEPIERESVFQDLNPLTVALNQQLNEQTVMQQQTYTYWNHVTPRYYFSTLVSDDVRPLKRILPMLPDGHVWIGRGEIGDNPDDISTQFFGGAGTGNVMSSGPGMRASITRWTGVDFVVTDSEVNIDGPLFEPTAGTVEETSGFSDDWAAMHWPAHNTGGRPASPLDGDTYYDTTDNLFYGYIAGVWTPFGTGSGNGNNISLTVTQVAHGLVVGNVVRHNGTIYVTALANTAQNAEGVWLVSMVVDADSFVLTQVGYVTGLGAATYAPFTPGATYFLSDSVAGALSTTEPTLAATVSKPFMIATSTTAGWLFPWRGFLNTGFNGNGGGSGGSSQLPVNQGGHGFVVGDIVYCTGVNTYAKALSDDYAKCLATWMVVEVVDANNFVIQQSGYTNVLAGLTAGTLYYLSDSVAGTTTATIPTSPGSFNKPVFVAITAGSGFIIEQRPLAVNGNLVTVTQAAHGFVVEDVLRVLGSGTYTKALADSLVNSRASGIVVKVIDANTFVLQSEGFTTGFSGKVAATQYWLSAVTPGLLTSTEPTTTGEVSKPMFKALTATSGYILEQRPMLQPNANGGGGGGSGDGWEFVETQDLTGVTELNFLNLEADVCMYKLIVCQAVASGGAISFRLRVSADNGATYLSGAATYFSTTYYNYGSFGSNLGTLFLLSDAAGVFHTPTAALPDNGEAILYAPADPTTRTMFQSSWIGLSRPGPSSLTQAYGSFNVAQAHNAIKLFTDTNSFASGCVSLYKYVCA